ncbi:MAG: MOSC domain-containing protein [Nodosilinea sp.]
MSAYLARIDIFPIKSLDGVSLTQVTVLASGALQGDRRYALFDSHHRFINGKHNPAVHSLRSRFEPSGQVVHCSHPGQPEDTTFDLEADRKALETWLSAYFQERVMIQENPQQGFPDDTQAAGPTVISTATLEQVASWYGDLSLADLRRRFRTNLEIGGVLPFWEDRCFDSGNQPVRFRIGDVVLEGVNPCQRCIVPTRDPDTGVSRRDFQATFVNQRAATLPSWAPRSRFNHFYHLAVNSNIRGQGGKTLRVGDRVTIDN